MPTNTSDDRLNKIAQAHHDGMARLLDALAGKDAEIAKAKADASSAEKARDDAVNQLADYLEKSVADINSALGAPAAPNAAAPANG